MRMVQQFQNDEDGAAIFPVNEKASSSHSDHN